jgi:hypothetical protein
MTEQFLDRADVGPPLEQVRGERMPQRVAHHRFDDPGGCDGALCLCLLGFQVREQLRLR